MPNGKEEDYGLDFGPAPLDVKKAAENALKKGKPLSLETLSAAAGRQVTADELDAAAANTKSNPLIFSPSKSQIPETENKGYNPKTARQIVLDLSEQRGITLGDALEEFAKIYDENLAGVRLLPDAAQVRAARGGMIERFATRTLESAAKLPLNVGSYLPGEIGKASGEAYEKLEAKHAAGPQDLLSMETAGDLAGYGIDMAMVAPLTTAAVGAIVPKIPWVVKGADTILGAVKAGKPVMPGMMEAAESALVRSGRILKLADEAATFAATDVARGESPYGNLGVLGGITALKLAAKWKPLANLAAKIGLGKTATSKAMAFLSKATGKTEAEIKNQFDTGESMLNALNSMEAPDVIKQQIFNAASVDGVFSEFADYLGIKAAEWKATPQQLESWIGSGMPKFQQAARKSYDKATGNWRAEGWVPLDVVDEPVARGFVDIYFPPLSQWARTQAKTWGTARVRPRVFAKPLVVDYKASDMAAGKLPADIVVEQLAAKHPEGAKALQILHTPWESSDGQAYNNMVLSVAGKLAKESGYGAIKVNGPTVAEDFIADLSRLKRVDLDKILTEMESRLPAAEEEILNGAPAFEEGLARSVGAMEVEVPKSKLTFEKPQPRPENPLFPGLWKHKAERDLADIERLKQRVSEAKNPDEANFAKKALSVAVRSYQRDFPKQPNPLEALKSKIVGIRGNLPKGGSVETKVVFGDPAVRNQGKFIELITPENESLLADPSDGSMHTQLLLRTDYKYRTGGTRAALENAIKDGYVRAGRTLEGPFVEFSHDAKGAQRLAADFIVRNARKGDVIRMDIWKGGEWKAAAATDVGDALKKIDNAAGYPWNVQRVTRMREFLGIAGAVGAGAAGYEATRPEKAEAGIVSKAVKAIADKKIYNVIVEEAVLGGKHIPMDVVDRLVATAWEKKAAKSVGGKILLGSAEDRKQQFFIEMITPSGDSLVGPRHITHPMLLDKFLFDKPIGDLTLAGHDRLAAALDQGFVRAGRSVNKERKPELFVTFNDNAPGAVDKAIRFLETNYNEGDNIVVDMQVGEYGKRKSFEVGSLRGAISRIINKGEEVFATKMRDFLVAPLVMGAGAAAAAAYEMLEPSKAEAGMLDKFVKKAIESEGKELMKKMASAATEKEIVAAGKQIGKESAIKAARDAGKIPLEDNMLNHAATGAAPTAEAKRFLGLFGNNYGVKWGSRIRPVWDQSDHPLWQWYWAKFIGDKDVELTGANSVSNQLVKLSGDLLEKNKINPIDDSAEFTRAYEGLQMLPDGTIRQVFSDIKANVAAAAREMKEQIIDPIFEDLKGVSVRAHAIAGKYGMADEPETWNKLKWLQTKYDALDPKNNTWRGRFPTLEEQKAAKETLGMLNFDNTSDLALKYNEGYFTLKTIDNERAAIADRIKNLVKDYPAGLPSDKLFEMDQLKNRMAQLDLKEATDRLKPPPNMQRLKGKHYFAPVSEKPSMGPKIPMPEVSKEKDLKQILSYHVKGAVHKRFWDKKVVTTRALADNLRSMPYKLPSGEVIGPNPNLAAKLIEDVNALRGTRSPRDDQVFADMWDETFRVFGIDKKKTISEVSKAISNIGYFQYATKVALNPAFGFMNSTQPLVSTSIVTGFKHLFGGYAKALTDWNRAYKEALEAGILKFESGYVQELDRSKYLTPLENAIDWIPSKTEHLNRVVTYHAAKAQALEGLAKGNFQVPSYVKLFDRGILETGTDQQIAQEYAKAVVRTTQFLFGPEGRPEILIGGGMRRLTGQFKSFTTGYTVLAKDVLKYTAQTKDPLPLARMLGALTFFGGMSAIPVGGTLYDLLRREGLKHGINLPSGSFLGYMTEKAGQVYPLNEYPEVRDALNAIQASGKFNPLNYPSGDNLLSWLLGPTLGSAADVIGYGIGSATGVMPPGEVGAKAAQSLFGPLAAKGPALAQDLGAVNDLGFGYRGGSFSPTGKDLRSDKDTVLNAVLRAAGLQPPVRVRRWEYLADLKAMLEGGQMDMARELIEKADRDGVKITSQDVSGVMGKITRERRERMPNQ